MKAKPGFVTAHFCKACHKSFMARPADYSGTHGVRSKIATGTDCPYCHGSRHVEVNVFKYKP